MKSDLRIPLDRIPEEGLRLDVGVEAKDLVLEGGGWPPVSDARIAGLLERVGNQEAVFRGRALCTFTVECSLGLARFQLAVEEEFTVFFQPPRAGEPESGDEVELEEGELEVYPIESGEVDLGVPLHDQIGLAIPLQPKCPGKCLGDTPALCERLMKGEVASAEGDADPKWSALEKWGK